MLIDNDRGGGGALFSTASDLVLWNDALTNAHLGKFVSEKLQEPATLNNGRKLNYARVSCSTPTTPAKDSGTAAARPRIDRCSSVFPSRGFSIAVLCNAGEASDDRDDSLPASSTCSWPTKASTGLEPSAPREPAWRDVNSKAGLFFNERTGDPLRLIVNNGSWRSPLADRF